MVRLNRNRVDVCSITVYSDLISTVERQLHFVNSVVYQECRDNYFFDVLSTKLIAECSHLSSPTILKKHNSYIKIVELGETILPLLCNRLDKHTSFIFIPLLAEITKESPVKPTSRGIMKEVISDWKNWGIENGHTSK